MRTVTLYTLPNGYKAESIGVGTVVYTYTQTGSKNATYIKGYGAAFGGTSYLFGQYNAGNAIISMPPTPTIQSGTKVYSYNGNSAPVYAGTVGTVSVTYYTVTTKTSGSGSISGGGEFESGQSTTITATPSSSNVVSTLTGYSGTLPSQTAVSFTQIVVGDITITATFTSYYNVNFSANGGSGAPASMNMCYTGTTYYIPTSIPTRSKYTFLGWAKSSSSSTVTYAAGSSFSNLGTGDITLYAVWKQITLTYNTDGGSPSISKSKGAIGDIITLPTSRATSKDSYVLAGWKIDNVTYLPGASYTLTDTNKTATAQWRLPTIFIRNEEPSNGSLKLYKSSIADSNLVASTSDTNDTLSYDGANGKYVIVCSNSNTLYYASNLSTGQTATNITTSSSQIEFTLSGSIEGTVQYSKRATYSVSFSIYPEDAGSAELKTLSGSTTPEDGEKWIPQVFQLYITANAGYSCASLHVVDKTDGSSSQPQENYPDSLYQLDLSAIDDDILVDLVFEKEKFKASASVYETDTAIGQVTVNDNQSETRVEYGTEVTYKASLLDGVDAENYRFAGWYKDDALVSTEATYVCTVTENITLVARFEVRCILDVVFWDNREDTSTPIEEDCSVIFMGQGYLFPSTESIEQWVFINTTGTLAVVNRNWFFNAWYNASDTAFENALDIENKIGVSYVVPGPINLVARETTVKIQSSLIVKVCDNNTKTEIAPSETNPVITSSGYDTVISDDGYSFTLDGTGNLTINAAASIVDSDGNTLAFNCFATGTQGSADFKVLASTVSYSTYLNSIKKTIYALYGDFSNVDITLIYGANSDRTMGSISIDDVTNETSGAASVTKAIMQGTTCTISATEKNGYVFAGWYLNNVSGKPFSTANTLTYYVQNEQTILATFKKNVHALYEWEGSSENKMMEWKSKIYVANKPFNPSAVRVDTNGYPVGEMRVGMFSAPDAKETAVSVLKNVQSQTARRLPTRRAERYMQVTIKNDQEVDRVLIGTSMGGIAV